MTRKLTRVWTPVSLSGGHRAQTCVDHPNRTSISVFQNGAWVDTGLCATDMARVERMDRMVARAAARHPNDRRRCARCGSTFRPDQERAETAAGIIHASCLNEGEELA
jgi:hypothetical protein